MVELTFNGRRLEVPSIEGLGAELERIDVEPRFELWISMEDGPSMCMLRNGSNAWLMYLREAGDSGFRSSGDPIRPGLERFWLGNGQVDEYPLSWCIDVERCYKAVAYFFVNDGARPDWIVWSDC